YSYRPCESPWIHAVRESHCGLNGNAHLKMGVAGNGFDGDQAAHFLNDAVHHIETEAGAFAYALGGEKRLENAGLYFGWNARTVVDDFHEHVFIFARRAHEKLSCIAHCVGGIVEVVGPRLLALSSF